MYATDDNFMQRVKAPNFMATRIIIKSTQITNFEVYINGIYLGMTSMNGVLDFSWLLKSVQKYEDECDRLQNLYGGRGVMCITSLEKICYEANIKTPVYQKTKKHTGIAVGNLSWEIKTFGFPAKVLFF